MTSGLVLGKFYPLHTGHIALIEFAQTKCDKLFVLICASDKETLPGETRLLWLKESFDGKSNMEIILLNYNEIDLPNTSVSSREVSMLWAEKIKNTLGELDCIISSEPYGDFLAEYLGCRHCMFDERRLLYQISGSKILDNPLQYWDFIAAAARPYFVKKVCIYGTESTGKSTLTAQLASYFNTTYVPEMAREVIQETTECTPQHLLQIASLQAKTILDKTRLANRILFVDTDLNITRSYSKFLFGTPLVVDEWVIEANRFDLYLYLDNDAPYIQDGTRLEEDQRNLLNEFHRKELTDRKISYQKISGTWDERLKQSILVIDSLLNQIDGSLL